MTRGTTSLESYLTIESHFCSQQRTAPSDNGEGGPVRLPLTLSGGFDEGLHPPTCTLSARCSITPLSTNPNQRFSLFF
jgi:hypothetical protein